MYHLGCLRAGEPFKTRLKGASGLSFPDVDWLPHFTCECCTVRAILQREVLLTSKDLYLLGLERMRMIDVANKWALSTQDKYRYQIGMIKTFAKTFDCPLLLESPLDKPIVGESIPLQWAQQHYSLRRTGKRDSTGQRQQIKYATVRGLRSAVFQYHTWDMQLRYPGRAILVNQCPQLTDGCAPTNDISFTLMAAGMSRRLGEDSKPSKALLARHVEWMEAHFDQAYRSATTLTEQRRYCRAALCTLFGWLGWLRAMEVLGLTWEDLTYISPADGPSFDLPLNIGALLLRLLPSTKSSPTVQADVVLAYATASGLSPGAWFARFLATFPMDFNWTQDDAPLFVHDNGVPWTSRYYRETYLIPCLELMQLDGDPYLREFDGLDGRPNLAQVFYSFHSLRIGARNQVSVRRRCCVRRATTLEVYEHGRWRLKRSTLPMDAMYLQWTLHDRVAITALCM